MKYRRQRRRHEPPEVVDPPPVAGRVPPHDLDAEAAVLSACMLDRGACETATLMLKPEMFYSEANARIFQAIRAIAAAVDDKQRDVDVVSVVSWLRDREWLHKLGGSAYIATLADATPAVGHVETHAKTVIEKWKQRSLIARAQRIFSEGYGDVGEFKEWAVGHVEAIDALVRDEEPNAGLQPIATTIKETFQKIATAAENGERVTGIPTGFGRYDNLTAGLHEGDLIIVAGRPGTGKTSFVLNIATNIASPRYVTKQGAKVTELGLGVCVFSLEMPREQNTTRMVCSEGRVDLGRMRSGQLHAEDWRKLTEAGAYLSTLPIWIDDTPGISVMEIRAKVRRTQAVYNREATDTQPARKIGVVVVDYLQLMKGSGNAQSREQEVAEISRGLKGLAKELKVPVIALSQLNRLVETRSTKDKRPQISDLRESGQIEADADTIILLYRDEVYNPDTDKKGIAELIIGKQRNGPPGKVYVRFEASCTRFDNLEACDYPVETD